MKKTLVKLTLSLAAVAAISTANAQLKVSNGNYDANDYYSTVTAGDLILGVMNFNAAGAATGNNLMINLGSFSLLSSLGTINIAGDLAAAGITSFTQLQYGVFGISGNYVYGTSASINPYANLTTSGLNSLSYGALVGVNQVFGAQEDNGQATANGIYIANADSSSFYSQEMNGFGAGIYGNGALNVAIGSSANFFESLANTAGTGFGSKVGSFNLDNSGNFSYTASAVPEPSTYALMGLGALLLVIAYRRKSNA